MIYFYQVFVNLLRQLAHSSEFSRDRSITGEKFFARRSCKKICGIGKLLPFFCSIERSCLRFPTASVL